MSQKDWSEGYDDGYKAKAEEIMKWLFEEGKHRTNFYTKEPYFESNFDRLTGCGCCAELDRDWLIELIKGEQSE